MAEDGGPAFPAWRQEYDIDLNPLPNPGMSLRDYFAAAVVEGFILDDEDASFEEYAIRSYMMADAMLSAREGGG